jgi:hypothetical protein
MNKTAIIGIIIVIAIIIGVVSSMSSMEKVGDDVLLTDEELILDEIVPEEDSAEEPETTGKSLTVELSESMKFKAP